MNIKQSCYCLFQTFLVFLFFTLITASEIWSNVDSGKWARSSLGKTYWTASLKPLPIDWEDWGQEEKGVTEEGGWMTSLTQWTWIWANSRRWWKTGKSGMLQSMRLQRVGHDLVTENNKSATPGFDNWLRKWSWKPGHRISRVYDSNGSNASSSAVFKAASY